MSDPRTGLGRFREFTIPNYLLMANLMQNCREMSAEEILVLPDIKERLDLYNEQSKLFKKLLEDNTTTHDNVLVTDLRGADIIYAGNRFMIYALFPEQNVSLWIIDGRNKQNTVISCGYSVVDRSCTADVGAIMYKNGGGGHHKVGTCQIDNDKADGVIEEIINELKGK